ncbi:MAG: DUF4256 domain-containing protein [Anaerolineae bacterium]|nr:DUF4256 domain-containing protein [Anaerolineae bacterium]MDW8170914.1 DUF4256 domain-containing protein [Anaerolineae bacterium]
MILSAEQSKALLALLSDRFKKHISRHAGLDWASVQARLEAYPAKLWSLYEMERSGGEPDVVAYDAVSGAYVFYDCSSESPMGRRSLCYDQVALTARKANQPLGSALGMAEAMGIELLDEEQYRALQTLGQFDRKTSSWIKTPPKIRQLGGALFADRRYDTVFIYHNRASSYYASRGFRGALIV